jgi:ABC-type multidrug transport system ATPase subunit
MTWRQFKALVVKNLRVKRFRIKQTLSELLYPIYIVGILIVVNFLTTSSSVFQAESFSPVSLFNSSSAPSASNLSGPVWLAFAPESDATVKTMTTALQLLQQRQSHVGFFPVASLQLRPCANSSALEQLYFDSSLLTFFAGVDFKNDSIIELRFNETVLPSPTLAVSALDCRTNSTSCTARRFVESGFTALQIALSQALAPSLQNVTAFNVTQFPVEAVVTQVATPFLRFALGVYFVMAFGPIAQYLCVNVVGEKQKKLQVHLQTIGMATSAHYGSWLVVYVAVATVSVSVVTLLASVFKLLDVNALVLFALLESYALSLLGFGFVVSAVMTGDKAAGLVAALGGLVLSLPQYAAPFVSFQARFALALSAPTALSMTLTALVLEPETAFFSTSEWSVGHGIAMCLVDALLYFLLSLYLEKVWPMREFGVARHPLFCCWSSSRAKGDDMTALDLLDGGAANDAADFEAIEYSAADVAVSFRDVHKHYDGGAKKAVVGVNFTMLQGEIVGLIGANGSGKSSLINVLTGVVPATKGAIRINGVDIGARPDAARKSLGVCAQQDILFDELTVIEHMRLYAAIKNLAEAAAEAEISQLLADVGLHKEANKRSALLSGGMKRRLSFALALLGKPTLLVLDECSAALDPLARKKIWEVLRRDAASRVTLMSSHFLDELEIVCDRTIVMQRGRFVVAGTSQFLKKRFQIAYTLTLACSSAAHVPAVREWLERELPGGGAQSVTVEKSSVFVKLVPSPLFPAFFRKLSAAQPTLAIDNVSLDLPTLESVFLKIQAEAAEDGDGEAAAHKSDAAHAAGAPPGGEADSLLDRSERGRVVSRSTPSFLRQVHAVSVARVLMILREPKFYVFSVVLPVAFMFVGSFFGAKQASSVQQDAATFSFAAGLAQLAAANAPAVVGALATSSAGFLAKLPALLPANVTIAAVGGNVSAVDGWLLHNQTVNSTVLGVFGADAAALELFYNASFVASLPALVQTSLMAAVASPQALNVSFASHALPGGGVSFDSNSFMGVLFVGLALTFTPGTYAIDVVRDRATGVKHQLRLAGLRRAAYWSALLTTDLAMYALIGVAAIILFHVVPMAAFTGPALPAVLLSMALFLPTVILFAFVLSFLFGSNVEAAQSMLPPALSMVGVVSFIVVALVDLGGQYETARIIHMALSFAVPTYPLSGALYFINRVALLSALGVPQTITVGTYFAWSTNVAITYVASTAHMIVFAVLVIVLDRRADRARASVLRGAVRPDDAALLQRPVDEDVAGESQRVAGLLQRGGQLPLLLISKVWKSFRIPQVAADAKNAALKERKARGDDVVVEDAHDGDGSDEQRRDEASEQRRRRLMAAPLDGTIGTSTHVRVAVENASLAVEKGSVAVLLGVNGAGKSTLMGMVVGDLAPDQGDIFIANQRVDGGDRAFEALGFCPQRDSLFELLSVEQHLRLYARIKGVAPHQIEARIEYLLRTMQIGEFRRVVAKKLSGGTKRKLSLAISLISAPQVLVLDEISTGVDVSAKRFLWKVVRAQADEQAIVLTTHSLEEAEALADRCVLMVNGQLVALGSVSHLRERFGRGLQLEVKSSPETSGAVASAVCARFGATAELLSSFHGLQRFMIRSRCDLADGFAALEALQCDAALRVDSATLAPTTLQDVFIEFALLQHDDERAKQ